MKISKKVGIIGVALTLFVTSACSQLGFVKERKSVPLNNNIANSKVYRYLKSFEVMDSAELKGQIVTNVDNNQVVTDFACIKDNNRKLSYLKSSDIIAWAEYTDGRNNYALNMNEKSYEQIDNLSLDTYSELNDLFNSAIACEDYGNNEIIYVYNEGLNVNCYVDCRLSDKGVVLVMLDKDNKETGKMFTLQVSSIKQSDIGLLSLDGYTEQKE